MKLHWIFALLTNVILNETHIFKKFFCIFKGNRNRIRLSGINFHGSTAAGK